MSIRPLSAELAAIAKEELNEDPKRIQDYLENFRSWLLQQPHLKARSDDQSLIIFLRGCKYRLERAKEKIDAYYSLLTTAPDLFWVEMRQPNHKEIINSGVIFPLLKTASPTSPRIVLLRMGKYDPNKCDMVDITAVSHAEQRILFMEDDQAMVCGVNVIIDMADVKMSHLAQATPAAVKKMIYFFQNASPTRVRGLHYLNVPPGSEVLFNLIKTFLNENNKKKIYIHNKNYESLYKHIPKEILPEGYGDEGSSIQSIIDHWANKIEEYRSVLLEDLTFGTDESKRPGKPRTAADMFGLDGSFMQLEFD